MGKKGLSALVRDFVFGMEDGLVSNLGLVLGVYFGGGSAFAVLLAGLASMFAGAFSMGAGSYLSAKSQREVYEHEIKTTKERLEKNPAVCISEMKRLLVSEGLTTKQAKSLFDNHPKNKHPEFICNYVVQKKVGISTKKFDAPFKSALMMFFSFLFGSLFPIISFIFLDGMNAVRLAVALTVVVLFIVGVAKTKYTKRNWFKSGIEIVLVGLGAGVIGYVVGLLIGMVG